MSAKLVGANIGREADAEPLQQLGLRRANVHRPVLVRLVILGAFFLTHPLPPAGARRHPSPAHPTARPPARPSAPEPARNAPPRPFVSSGTAVAFNVQKLRRRRVVDARELPRGELQELRARHTTHHGD